MKCAVTAIGLMAATLRPDHLDRRPFRSPTTRARQTTIDRMRGGRRASALLGLDERGYDERGSADVEQLRLLRPFTILGCHEGSPLGRLRG